MNTYRIVFLLATLLGFVAVGRVLAAGTESTQAERELTRVMADFRAAVERVDVAGVLALAADVPEFRYVMPDGMVTDFAGWKQGHIDYFATVAAHRLTEKSQQITVLAPDTAQVTWLGTMDIVPKDGPVQRVDPFAATFLFKRTDGAWKLVHQHESGPPPQPVAPVSTPADAATELRRADAELVAAANARDLERWLACFERDATLIPPGAPPIAGKDAIRPAAAGLMQCPDFAVAHTITAVGILPSGTSAWVTYDFTFTANGEDGRPMTECGTDRTLYRKGPDGRWRVLVDVWNTDEATTAAATPAVLTALDDAFTAVNAFDAERFLRFFIPDEGLTVFEDKDLHRSRKVARPRFVATISRRISA